MKRAKLDLRPRTAARLDATSPGVGGDPPPPTAGGPVSQPSPTRPRSREGTKALTAHVPRATAKRFALLALDLDKSHQALLEEAIADIFAKYNKPPQ